MKKIKESIRSDFPLFQKENPVVYLDSAATAQKPKKVLSEMFDFYSHSYGTVHRGAYALSRESTEKYAKVRQKVQAFLQAGHPEEIIFTRGATQSLNLLARSFGKAFIQEKDVILLSEVEHHSNLIPWQMLSAERGAVLRFIPVNEKGELDLDAFRHLLNDRVKLVSLAHLSNVLGTIHPVKEIIRQAHEKGARVCLDGAQAAAQLPINVQDLDADFYVFSGHKLYGPTGVGILYGKKELLEVMPPIEGGGDMVDKVTLEKSTYNTLPLKFEAGTPMIAEVIGLGSALDYLREIEMEAVFEHAKSLLDYATAKLKGIPEIKIIGTSSEKGGIISFVHERWHPLDIASLLDCRGISIRSGNHCSQPTMKRFNISSACRISFGIYNTMDEIHRLIAELHAIFKL